MNLKTGQKLWCKNGEYVTVKIVVDDYIFLIYKGKTYKRHKSIIGKTLFLSQLNNKKHSATKRKYPRTPASQDEYFQNFDRKRSEKTMSEILGRSWPTEGDATRFRRHNKKK